MCLYFLDLVWELIRAFLEYLIGWGGGTNILIEAGEQFPVNEVAVDLWSNTITME